MKLLLTSEGITNKSIKKSLRSLLGKDFSESKVLFVPTAANYEGGDKSGLIDNYLQFIDLKWASFDILDIAAVSSSYFTSRLRTVDALGVGGGDPEFLMQKISEKFTNDEFKELIRDKVYVGISSGSMILAQKIAENGLADLYNYPQDNWNIPALGIVPFCIIPHYLDATLKKLNKEKIQKLKRTVKHYAICDQSAICIDSDKIEIVSEGEWFEL